MPHKQYTKFAVETHKNRNVIVIKYYPLGVNGNSILEQIDAADIVAEYSDNPESLKIAEGTCRLLNQAYSSGHARGMEYVKESLTQAMGFEE